MQAYLQGRDELVNKLITPINYMTSPSIPSINLLTKSPCGMKEPKENAVRVLGCGPCIQPMFL